MQRCEALTLGALRSIDTEHEFVGDVRRIRPGAESPRQRLARDLLYGALVLAALPFTVVEAACRAGSTIMIEARKKA